MQHPWGTPASLHVKNLFPVWVFEESLKFLEGSLEATLGPPGPLFSLSL